MFQKVEKAHLAKQKWSKGASSSMRHLRVKPTQMHPKVEQQKSQADQHEAIGGIGRSRPAQQFIAKAIARLNAKPLPVSLPTLFRSPVQSNHYKHQPLGATLATSGAPRRGEDTADGQLRPELLLLAFIEDVLSAITRSPSTQSSGSAFLASDRTSDQRGLLAAAQVLEYRDAGKTFVEVEDANPQRPQQQRLPQLLDHFHGLIPWQYESNRQGHSLPMEDGVSCRDPIETSRPIFGFAEHPQGFLLFLLAVVGAVVKIEGDFYGAATSQFLRPVGSQAIVDRALQILQLFNRKLPPEIATNGLGIRSAGQFRADRLSRSTVGCDSNQDVIERVACDAIPVRFQRQEYFQGLFRLIQDFFIIEFWLIMIRRFIIIRIHGLFLQIHKESNKPFYFKPYGPHRPILGLLSLAKGGRLAPILLRRLALVRFQATPYKAIPSRSQERTPGPQRIHGVLVVLVPEECDGLETLKLCVNRGLRHSACLKHCRASASSNNPERNGESCGSRCLYCSDCQ